MKSAIVVTSISEPNDVIRELAEGSQLRNWGFYVVGDKKSPAGFEVDGCKFYSLEHQRSLDWSLISRLPVGHYSRKNIGYLVAAANGADIIQETDDDNFPLESFWDFRDAMVSGRYFEARGWVNAYLHFGGKRVWPRGVPLEVIRNLSQGSQSDASVETKAHCPIQQALANGDTDVDAVYRLLIGDEVTFENSAPMILGPHTWCPFNSQSTFWWREAFLLLYLPSTCSFRMTDIWRSFVAQRCLWACGWRLAFLPPAVFQARNAHNLMVDFQQEIPGYLHNDAIRKSFDALDLANGPENLASNMIRCYERLVSMSLVSTDELNLLEAWIADMGRALEMKTP